MLNDFNLLISTSRRNERNACSEAWYLLREAGDRESKVDVTLIIGLIVAKTNLKPEIAVQILRKILIDRPWEFRYVLKISPLQILTESDLDKIVREVEKLKGVINKDESFRITIGKRRSQLKSKEIIETVANKIDRRVNLVSPDKVILIEVIGGITGISVIKPDEILSVEREKRGL